MILQILLISFWFFLPAGFSNMTPPIVAKIPLLRTLNQPIDGGKTYKNKPLLGKNKTWRGLISGTLAGGVTSYLLYLLYTTIPWVQDQLLFDYSSVNPMLLGLLLGFGALMGDAIESLLKRQREIPSGKSWLFFDQSDYIFGAIITTILFYPMPIQIYISGLVLFVGLHILVSYIAYEIGIKNEPI